MNSIIFVLVLVVGTNRGGGVTTQEFHSEESCIKAMEVVNKTQFPYMSVNAICVQK